MQDLTTLLISTRNGIRIACTSAPGSLVQVLTHCRRFLRIALRDLHTWRTAGSIWRTCATPASGGKCLAICRWRRRLTPSGIKRFSIPQDNSSLVCRIWLIEFSLFRILFPAFAGTSFCFLYSVLSVFSVAKEPPGQASRPSYEPMEFAENWPR